MGAVLGTLGFAGATILGIIGQTAVGTALTAAWGAVAAAATSAFVSISEAAGFIYFLVDAAEYAGAGIELFANTVQIGEGIYRVTSLGYAAFYTSIGLAAIGLGTGLGFAIYDALGNGGDPLSPYAPIEDRIYNKCFEYSPFQDELSSSCGVRVKRENNVSMESRSKGHVGLQYNVPESVRSVVEQQLARGQYRSDASRQMGQQGKRMR